MSCEHTNPVGFAFCGTCGQPLDTIACRCGFHNLKKQTYCGRCGFKLSLFGDKSLQSASLSTVGKYNLEEFISTVEIQKKQEAQKQQETDEDEKKRVDQDDIASLFGNLSDDNE